MRFSFDVESSLGDVYRVTLSSGADAFFANETVFEVVGDCVEVVEIDLDRIAGNNKTDSKVLAKIAEGIAHYFLNNNKAVLYYYCDDLNEVPMSNRKDGMWPQEYRSKLFSIMYERYIANNKLLNMMDIVMTIEQGDRPLYMHLIARRCHAKYIEMLKEYIMENYGK